MVALDVLKLAQRAHLSRQHDEAVQGKGVLCLANGLLLNQKHIAPLVCR